MKKIILTVMSISLLVPFLAAAQSETIPTVPVNIDLKNLPNNLPAPVSDFVNKLKGIFETGSTGNVSLPNVSPNVNLSDVGGTWASINNWFVSKIGISLSDIVKTVVNLIIWVWELIIKLIQTGLSYL